MPRRDERAFIVCASAVEDMPEFMNSSLDRDVALRRQRMSVNLIFKIAAVGILVSVLSQVLKHSGREEQAFLTSLAGLLLVLFWIVPYIYDLFEDIRRLFSL